MIFKNFKKKNRENIQTDRQITKDGHNERKIK